jgi:hypothetical protein
MKKIIVLVFCVYFITLCGASCTKKITTGPGPAQPTSTMTIVIHSPTVTTTSSITYTITITETGTETFTITPTFTVTETGTDTYTVTDSPTITETHTDTDTCTVTPTYTVTNTATATPTVTITKTPCVIFGNPDLSFNTASGLATYSDFEMFTSAGPAVVTKIYFFCGQSGSGYKVGLYSDASGCPGTLLTSNQYFVYPTVSAAWYAVDVPDYAISAGNYWLAITSDGNNYPSYGEHWESGSPAVIYVRNSLGLPANIGTGCSFYETYPTYTMLLYASCE